MRESNDPTPPGDDSAREWPTHCEHCGTELESAVVDAVPDSDTEHLQTGSPGTVIAQDFCPNPDCPGKRSSAAPADRADDIE